MYGGQVVAQAVLAAARTVADDWQTHSLHAYFVRRADGGVPTEFQVERQRDGRSFSARRVTATQGGDVVFSMAVSLTTPGQGPDLQQQPAPGPADPEHLHPIEVPRMPEVEGRIEVAGRPDLRDPQTWPTRWWVRSKEELPAGQAHHQAVLGYVSDAWSGMSAVAQPDQRAFPSLDHALWFHRPVRLDHWVLIDLVPQTSVAGRGFYTGTFWQDGQLVASLAQECLFS